MKCPKHLSPEAAGYWQDLHEIFDLDTDHDIILKTALEAYDRLQEARELISRDGVTYRAGDNGLIKENPACKIEKEARSGMLQAWRLLGFDAEPPKEVGRPPGSWQKKD